MCSDTLYEVYIIVRIVTYNFVKLEGMPDLFILKLMLDRAKLGDLPAAQCAETAIV